MAQKKNFHDFPYDDKQAHPGQKEPLQKIENPENLTDNDKMLLDRILKGNKHMYALYVSKNGIISQHKYLYTGGFADLKEYEGKYFTKFGFRPKKSFDSVKKQEKNVNTPIPLSPEHEVASEYLNPNYSIKKVECVYDYQERMENILMDFYKPGYIPTKK